MRAAGRVIAATVWTVLGTVCLAQVEVSQTPEAEQGTSLSVDAISFAIANSPRSRLDVYVQVPYENLSFVKQTDRYYASYELTLDVLDSAGSLVSEKVWTEEIQAASFDESVSSQAFSITQRVFELDPGRYRIAVTMRDNETKTVKNVAKQLLVSDYNAQPFTLSDVMLVSKLSVSGERKVIVPNISSNVDSAPGSFHVFFEAYGGQKNDTVRFVATVFNEKNEEQLEVDTTQVMQSARTQVFMRIENDKLSLGDYRLLVRAFPARLTPGQEQKSLASTNRLFSVRWRGMPKGLKDLDIAIEQLQYVARDNEVSYIQEAKTAEEKQKRFLEFWKKRDPNPNTPRNEKMEQYYVKVEYANKHFKHYIDGWRTDMGMVYIIFGAPNNVDRHPFDNDAKPYEVWAYYELNHQFVFVDQTGFGDYRLITPIWEVWQRPKD